MFDTHKTITLVNMIAAHIIPPIFIIFDIFLNRLCFSILNLVTAVVMKVALLYICMALKLCDGPQGGVVYYYIVMLSVSFMTF